MTAALRPIETESYAAIAPPSGLGKPPKLEWLAIRDLVIDPEYQRDITFAGRGNVRRIVKAFNWVMFTPVVVAAVGSGKYAIVDGQHRTTAAALCGIDKVPCAVIEAQRGEQAAAFKAINGNTTRLTSIQLYHASVAAGDEGAVRIAAVCTKTDVTILRYPKAWNLISPGETMSPVVIGRALVKFGDEATGMALRAIRYAGGGTPGVLKAPIIFGTAEVLHDHPEWRVPQRLTEIFDLVDLDTMFEEAASVAARTHGSSVTDQFESRLVAALAMHFGKRKSA